MKTRSAIALLLIGMLLTGCYYPNTWSFDGKWLDATVAPVWQQISGRAEMPLSIQMVVRPGGEYAPSVKVMHSWTIDWDDGTTDEWSDHSHSIGWIEPGIGQYYPEGNTQIWIEHTFPDDGKYMVRIEIDGGEEVLNVPVSVPIERGDR